MTQSKKFRSILFAQRGPHCVYFECARGGNTNMEWGSFEHVTRWCHQPFLCILVWCHKRSKSWSRLQITVGKNRSAREVIAFLCIASDESHFSTYREDCQARTEWKECNNKRINLMQWSLLKTLDICIVRKRLILRIFKK